MKPDITDCSLSDKEKIKMLEDYIDELELGARKLISNLNVFKYQEDIEELRRVLE